jgi:hypothetical protein
VSSLIPTPFHTHIILLDFLTPIISDKGV